MQISEISELGRLRNSREEILHAIKNKCPLVRPADNSFFLSSELACEFANRVNKDMAQNFMKQKLAEIELRLLELGVELEDAEPEDAAPKTLIAKMLQNARSSCAIQTKGR